MTGRDDKGRFVKGNGGGPGRPRACDTDYLNVMRGVVSLADWKDIVFKAKEQAKRGNPTARKWLSDYLMGVPMQRQEITGADGGPLIAPIIMLPPVSDGE